MVFRGPADYGFKREARQMEEKAVALFDKSPKKEGSLYEYYVPDSSTPIMNKDFQNWNYLGLNMVA